MKCPDELICGVARTEQREPHERGLSRIKTAKAISLQVCCNQVLLLPLGGGTQVLKGEIDRGVVMNALKGFSGIVPVKACSQYRVTRGHALPGTFKGRDI